MNRLAAALTSPHGDRPAEAALERAGALLWAARRAAGVELRALDLPAAHALAAAGLAVDPVVASGEVTPGPWKIRATERGRALALHPVLCPRCGGRGFVGWARAACPECACLLCGGPRGRRRGVSHCVRCAEERTGNP